VPGKTNPLEIKSRKINGVITREPKIEEIANGPNKPKTSFT
jgi:hypothetical protein